MNKPKKAKWTKREWKYFYLVLPFMVVILLLEYVPLMGWTISLFDYRPGVSLAKTEFIGLKHFLGVFKDKDILRTLKNTLIFAGINFVLNPLPLVFAVCLNEIRHAKYKKFVQTVTTLPHFISWVIVYSFAYAIFSSEGVMNAVLMGMGITEKAILPLQNPDIVYPLQIAISKWKEMGWSAIIYIAAIAGIDQEQYEAARIDGAGRLKTAQYITIPNLMPTFITLLIMNVASIINTGYQQQFVFKNAIVYNKIEVLDLYIYKMGLQLGDYSYATAVGILKSIVSISLLFMTNAVAKKVRGSSIM